jgi:L-fuconolactonase
MFGYTHHTGELPPTPGLDRGAAMFESNFPVDKGSCGYAALWNAFKRIATGYSAAQKAALFAGTATKFYRLE